MNNHTQDSSGGETSSPSASSSALPSSRRSGLAKKRSNAPHTIDTSDDPQRSGTTTPTSEDEKLAAKYPKRIILERDPISKEKKKKKGGIRPSFLSMKQNRRPSYTVHAPNTPFDELDLSEVDFLKFPDDQSGPKAFVRYRRFFFLIGIFLGSTLMYLASQNASMEGHIKMLKGMMDDQMLSLGVDLSSLDFSFRMPKEFAELGDNLFSGPRGWLTTNDFKVGRTLYAEGLRAEHPVVLMPGIISTGLESWTTDQATSTYFRKRLWGTTTMMRTIVLEKDLWIKHLSLDPITGLDPPGIKVRAAEGLDAASYFITGYWIWSKIIENLAAIGYDTNTLYMASYDWRLSYGNLEVRDKFFTRLKLRIEQNKALHGKKTVLVAHSMGSSVALYFMKWVEASGPGFGNGGDQWCEDHLEAFTNIAGTFLGVPKAMAALLSGEMRDTVEVPPAAAFLLEKFFSRKERARLFRTWAGSASMIIKGGNTIWGNSTWAPDDDEDATDSHGRLYSFRDKPIPPKSPPHLGAGDAIEGDGRTDAEGNPIHETSLHLALQGNLSADHALTWLLQHTPATFQQMVGSNYSNGIEFDEDKIQANNQNPRTWANPLEAALPNAPSMKVIALYGVGKSTERSYYYEKGPFEREDAVVENGAALCLDAHCANETEAVPLGFPTARSHWIDGTVQDEKGKPQIRSGCKMSDGDGTVSLLSLGAMTSEGWKRKRYNPGGSKIIRHELAHKPESMDLRGGETSGDHIDILGSRRLNEIILRVAAGRGAEVEDQVLSRVDEFASRINWDGPQ